MQPAPGRWQALERRRSPSSSGTDSLWRVRRITETSLYRWRDADAVLLLARNGLGGEWHLAHHELMQFHFQARVIYVNAYYVP